MRSSTDKNFNPFIASGAIGMCIDEFNGDNFDHGQLGFVGGGYMGAVQTNGRPILGTRVPQGTPEWGAAWKKAVAENYLTQLRSARRMAAATAIATAISISIRPTPIALGRKLMRMTFDFHDNELKMSQYLTDRLGEIVQQMGPRADRKAAAQGPVQHRPNIRPRIPAAARSWAADPKTSALNRYLQSWDVPNLFVTGATVFPQNAGYNPTGTVGALDLLGGGRDPRRNT